jgi:hypothetical protein
VTSPDHPLFGRLVPASGFRHRNGQLLLVVVMADGSPGTIAADATDIFGDAPGLVPSMVLSVAGVRHLMALVGSMVAATGSPSGPKTRK